MSTPPLRRILVFSPDPSTAASLESILSAPAHFDIRATTDAKEIAPLHHKWAADGLILDCTAQPRYGLDILAELHHALKARALVAVALINAGDVHTSKRVFVQGVSEICAMDCAPRELGARMLSALATQHKGNAPQSEVHLYRTFSHAMK